MAVSYTHLANLMTSMLLKEMKMPHVVSKAENALQGKMLKKMGVDMVIYPEYDLSLIHI